MFHLRRTCYVVGTDRKTSLQRRHDVLQPVGDRAYNLMKNINTRSLSIAVDWKIILTIIHKNKLSNILANTKKNDSQALRNGTAQKK